MRDQKRPVKTRDQGTMQAGFMLASMVATLLWLALYLLLPEIANMQSPLARLIFALKCWGLATLFCLLLGMEAVAHERFALSALNNLGDGESWNLRINQRYVQQTLEQMLVFVPGLLILAVYCDTGESMRMVLIATLVWILVRMVYWFGYHQGVQFRGVELVGMLQSTLILLYDCGHFAYEILGIAGALLVIILFLGIEMYWLKINKI